MKKPNLNGFRIPALAILATLALSSAHAQDSSTEAKEMRVKIITTIDGKTTIKDTTLAVTDNTSDIRRILGQNHPFFYNDILNTPGCRKAMPARTEFDGTQIRKNIEQRVWIRDTSMRQMRISGPIEIGEPEEIEKLFKTREVDIIRSPSVIRLQKDADGKVSEIKLDGNPMEIEKLLKEKGIEPGTMHFRSAIPIDRHRFTVINRDSLHSLNAQELRVFRSVEDSTINSRVIVLMTVEKPEAKDLEEVKELKENIPSPKREMEVENLSLYPNPTSGRFTLRFDLENKGNTHIRVYDVTGKEVYSEKVKKLQGMYDKEIDITGNPQGVYFVQVTRGKSGFTRKVVLQ